MAPFTNLIGSWLGSGTVSVGGTLRDVAVGLITVVWLTTVVRERRSIELSPGRITLIGFILLVLFLAPFSDDSLTAIYGARNLAFYTALLFIATDLLDTEERQRFAARAVLVSLSVMSILGIAEVLTGGAALSRIGFRPDYGGQQITDLDTIDSFLEHRRATAGVGNALDFGWLTMFGLLLAIGWPTDKMPTVDRWLRRAAIPLTGVGVILSLTRSAWLGTSAALVVMAVAAKNRGALRVLILVAAAVSIVIVVFPEAVYVDRLLAHDIASQTTTAGRLDIYQEAMRLPLTNPLGLGIGTQGSANRHPVGGVRFTLDSYYLELLGEGGVLLLVAYVLLMSLFVVELFRHVRGSPGHGFATGVLGIAVATLIADATSGSMDSRIIGIVFWFLMGLALRRTTAPSALELPRVSQSAS